MSKVKFIKRSNKGDLLLGLKADESYMCLGKDTTSPLIKVKDSETGPDKFGSLTDKEFIKAYMPYCICGCKEGCTDEECAHSNK